MRCQIPQGMSYGRARSNHCGCTSRAPSRCSTTSNVCGHSVACDSILKILRKVLQALAKGSGGLTGDQGCQKQHGLHTSGNAAYCKRHAEPCPMCLSFWLASLVLEGPVKAESGEAQVHLAYLCTMVVCLDTNLTVAALQLGVVVSNGSQATTSRAVSAGIAADPDCITFPLDRRISFSSISRDAMFNATAMRQVAFSSTVCMRASHASHQNMAQGKLTKLTHAVCCNSQSHRRTCLRRRR